jgi:hypothetical protein
MYYQSPSLLWCRVLFRFFTLFAQFERKDRLSSGLAFYSKLLDESLETFFELGFLHDYSKESFCFG